MTWRVLAINVLDDSLVAPPGNPGSFDAYIVANGGSGAWTGLDGALVYWDGTSWVTVVTKVPVGYGFLVGAAPSGSFANSPLCLVAVKTAWVGSYTYRSASPSQGQGAVYIRGGEPHVTYFTGSSWDETPGGGIPSESVVSELSFGQAASAGVSSEYSKGDHTHGTPSAPGEEHIDSTTDFAYNQDGSIDDIIKYVDESPVETAVFVYNLDGSINKIATTYVGSSKMDTFAYLPDGSVDTITTVWA